MVSTWSPGQVRLVMLDGPGGSVVAAEDVRGLDVRDASSEKVGEVDDLVVDPSAGRVRLLMVGSGGFFGIGRERRLIPVDVVESIAGTTVFLSTTRSTVSTVPVWGDIEGEAFLTEVYQHYECQPYWWEGYRAPHWARSD